MNENILSDELPQWFFLPASYLKILEEGDFENGDYDFGPSWQLLRTDKIEARAEGLKKRYPKRKLYPFARRVCQDDVACFDLSNQSTTSKVVIIHDWATIGWEHRGIFDNFEVWLEAAKNEVADDRGE